MKIPERTKRSLEGVRQMIKELEKKFDIKNSSIVEIGSWTGVSAVEFSKYFGIVYCVDPWSPTKGINTEYNMKEVEKIFDSRISYKKNIRKIKMTSEDYSKMLLGKSVFDFIYIDGDHTYKSVKKDILLWGKRIKKAICGHDYWPRRFEGVIQAVNECLGKPDKIFSDTSWVKYK